MKNELINKTYLNTSITFIGLAGAILTIYAFFFQGNQNKIQYEIITNSNVLDINTNISKLDIVYDSTSLKQKNQNLRVISLRVKNVGNENILKTYYDNLSPLGVTVNGGYIVENPEVLETSNEYLQNNLKAIKQSDNSVTFNDVILDINEFYEIKLLVLHELDSIPSLSTIGKIAGIKKIPIINSSEIEADVPFLKKVFSGNIFIQLTRGFTYFLIIVILIIANAFSSEYISGERKKRLKRKLIRSFEESTGYGSKRIHEVIFDNFKDNSLNLLKLKFSLLTDEKEINSSVKRWQEINVLKEEKEKIVKGFVDIEGITLANGYQATSRDERKINLISQMTSEGFLISDNDRMIVNNELKKTLKDFIEHLKRNKYKDNSRVTSYVKRNGEMVEAEQEY